MSQVLGAVAATVVQIGVVSTAKHLIDDRDDGARIALGAFALPIFAGVGALVARYQFKSSQAAGFFGSMALTGLTNDVVAIALHVIFANGD